MLISHRNKFIYLKTVKTGGTSIEVFFEKYCMKDDEWSFSHARNEFESETGIIGYRGIDKNIVKPKWYNHMPAIEIKANIGEKIWNEYFKFCVIRNPFEKVLSYFFHLVINECFEEKSIMISKFRNWIKHSNLKINIDRYIYTINNTICVDFYIRYENMIDDLKIVCQKVNVNFEPHLIPHLKNNFRPKNAIIEEYYNNETIDIIKKHYSFELDYFNYTIPNLV